MNVRKNIIIDQKVWDYLAGKAQAQKSSVSELIELAVKKEYGIEDLYARQKKAFQDVMQLKEKYPKITYKVDYKKMAHDGHKY